MVTININGLSLIHKASQGMSRASAPDVCKTPSPGGPVPIPYPNISFSLDLANGTTTVFADGGNSCAIKGSEFSKSIGDEPGTAGGVVSGVNRKESKWLSFSFDVKLDGANACRLSDKKTQNHGNTVDCGGAFNPPVPPSVLEAIRKELCEEFCKLLKAGKKKGAKWTAEIGERLATNKRVLAKGLVLERSAIVAVTKGMAEKWGRKAITKLAVSKAKKMVLKFIPVVNVVSTALDIYDAASLAKEVYDLIRVRPDFIIQHTLPDGQVATHVGDFKFPGDAYSKGQMEAFKALNDGKQPLTISKATCFEECEKIGVR